MSRWDWDAEEGGANRTPPGRLYHDPALHAQMLERVFAPSWQLVADEQEIEGTRPVTFLEGSLDEPLILARDGERRLLALSNLCTHRGHPVCTSPGRPRELRCGYHGRRFTLEGRCKGQPHLDGTSGFPGAEDDLRKGAAAQFGPWSFAALFPALAFEAWIAPAAERLAGLGLADLARDPAGDRAFELDASWLLYVENYLEGLHVPFAHPGLQAALAPGEYEVRVDRHAVVQIAGAPPGENCLPGLPGRAAALWIWLYPNLMLNAYPFGVSVNVIEPLGPGRCRVLYRRYVNAPSALGRGAGGDLDTVEQEDQAVVRAIQKGVRSRAFPRGRYVPGAEDGVRHFHRLLRDSMTNSSQA